MKLASPPKSDALSHPPIRTYSTYLNLLRAVAAFLVVVGHLRNLFFVNYSELSESGPLLKGFYFISGFGDQAVLFFFVLSGLFVGGSVLDTIQKGHWDWKAYGIQRLSRLWIVLLPALLLTFFWDSLGQALFGSAQIYGGDKLGGNVIQTAILEKSSVFIFLSNALFLQGITSTTAGSNGALWSLSFEFWYYLLFPLAVRTFTSKSKSERILCLALSLVVGYTMVHRGFMVGFVVWIMGVVTGRISSRIKWGPLTFWVLFAISGLLFGSVMVFARLRGYYSGGASLGSDPVVQWMVGFASSAVCLTALRARVHSSSYGRLLDRVGKFFSDFSFTLYLMHLPFLVFLRAAILSEARWQPSPLNIFGFFLLFSMTTLYCYGISRLTEAQTPKLRKWITRKFIRSKPELLPTLQNAA